MDAPPIQYCRTEDGVNIAYMERGSGHPLVMVPNHPYSHVQLEWESTPWYDQLAESCRLIRYDGRGNGMSDRDVDDLSIPTLQRDLEAVVETLGLTQFALWGMSVASIIATRYAASNPERVSRLFLWSPISLTEQRTMPYFEPMAVALRDDYELYRYMLAGLAVGWDEGEHMLRWGGEIMGQAATAAIVRASLAAVQREDLLDDLPDITSPTVIIGRREMPFFPPNTMRRITARLPNAHLVELDGRALIPYAGGGEDVLRVLQDHLDGLGTTSDTANGASGQAFRTLLFTDLESSTALTQALGDATAQEILHGHNDAVRAALAAHDGEEVKHTGDGIFAAFGSAVAAVEAALQIQRDLAGAPSGPDQVRVRIGLNAGEPIAEDDDYFGTAVQLAARVCDRAEPGQVLVSRVVHDLCAGKRFNFTDQGEATLKGFPEPVRLFVVAPG